MTLSPQLDRAEVPADMPATSPLPLPLHPDTLLTSVELAGVLKVNRRLPEVWRVSGAGPAYLRAGGRRVLYRWSDVLDWLNNHRFVSTSEEAHAA
jgi:hypothetical protein